MHEYTADKIIQEGERNKKLYDSASGRHQEFSMGETVLVITDAFSKLNR